MDDSITHPHPLVRWFQALPEPQRRIAPIVLLAVLVAGGWMISQRPGADAVVILPKSIAPAAGLAHLHERGLIGAQLNKAGKLVVPAPNAGHAKQYIDELSAVSTTWADEWEKSNSQLGQFSGNRERDAAKEIARARMIGTLLRQMPGVSQADVVWDEEETAGWRGRQKTRCTVYLRPRSGYEITADMARSVRQAVAGSKKHLAAEDIVVMDLDRMMTFDAVPAGVDDVSRTMAEREVVELRHQIEMALRDCPGVRVSVGVTWQETDAGEQTIELTPVAQRGGAHRAGSQAAGRLVSSNGFLEQLSRDENSEATGRFEPMLQVTVTAPEDSAALWAEHRVTESSSQKTGNDVIKAQFERPVKGKAADTIRQSVGTVLSRLDRRNLATGVSVHLTPAAAVATVVETLPDERIIDPVWFIALALAGCLGGAWVLSSTFSGESPTIAPASHGNTALLDAIASLENETDATEVPHATSSRSVEDVVEFEALIDCPPELWRELWTKTRPEDWVAALKGSSSQLRRTVLESLMPDDAANLEQLLAAAPALRLTQIDAAQETLRGAAVELLEHA